MKRPYLVLPLLFTACQVQMQAQASGSGTPAANTAAPAPVEPVEHRKSTGHGKTWSATFHKSGSVKFDWQGRSGKVCRSAEPFKFVGMAKLAGTAQLKNGHGTASGTADASGKVTGGGSAKADCEPPRTTVPPPVAETPPTKVPPKPSTKPEPPARTKPKPGDIGKAPPVNPSPVKVTKPEPPTPVTTPPVVTPPAGPTPTELDNPKDPPKEPPPNVFGYDEPVKGCFEGQVFPLAVDAQSLPPNYATLKPVSVVYACEWDIAPRSWDTGFPGIPDRFEWFAIRYAGSFHLAEAGDYTFRISSDDGTKLLIDNKLVVDNDGQHPPKVATGKVTLSTGDHAMVLEYFQGPRYQINLQVWVTPPGKAEELFTVR